MRAKSPMTVLSIIVMGVSGSGKSTIGLLLAKRLGAGFYDGDRLHPDSNIAKMTAGRSLTDEERLPWLTAVGEHLADARATGISGIIACSALKRDYRNMLREHVPELFVVFLDGPKDIISERIAARTHDFMPPSLLDSQFESLQPLEPDERGIRIDVSNTPDQIVDEIVGLLEASDAPRAWII